ncbi:MAG: glucan biosynthesis protein G [Polaromonas sp.]|uniref:glucan biosynthesis protein G n=1 Tax=Polaromonas sp. TaxID=1869339 RepID=UPI00272EF8A8|nr:glucan biosynthesis protein G [Polaromonas sp.]MDP2258040.1 glucan biosynthesis protein G [Polaromonas sp.]
MQAFFRLSKRLSGFAPRARFAALACAGALALTAAQAHAWSLDDVATLASQRAKTPVKEASHAVPAELAKMEYDDYRDIRFKPESTLWRADKLPYEANFFHVGRQGDSVRVHEITSADVKRVPYDPASFNFGKNKLSPKSWGDLGYGGVRAFSNLNSPTYKDELIVFSGASYFRALGAGQRYGLSARGLAVDTAGPAKEEFPRFTDFWLEKPGAEGGPLTIFALMDSERMTGAYRFNIKPGEQTVTEVQARIFMRPTDKPVATLGLAPLTSMFFFGENQPRPGDFRPEVHDSDGLMVATGDGEWLWRPLQNPASKLVTSFSMKSLKGFGLMQRDRAFHNYEDTEARYELRPSAWVTPVGDWGAGKVELLQFATPDETHDNVAAYWVPEKIPAPGQSIDIAYQIAWQGKNQQLPPNGWVTQSRRGTGYSKHSADAQGQQIQFVIDFAGPALDALPEDAAVKAVTTASANARVLESLAYKNPATGAWRMTLRVQRLPSDQPAQPIELRAFLQHNTNTLTETWTNLITP